MPIHKISVTFTPAAFRMLLTHSCAYVAVNLDAVNAYVRMDNSPAFKLMGDNWGSDLVKNVRDSTYGAINVLLDYEEVPDIKSDGCFVNPSLNSSESGKACGVVIYLTCDAAA